MRPFIRRFQTAQGLSKLVIYEIDEMQTIKELGRGLLKAGGELEAFKYGGKTGGELEVLKYSSKAGGKFEAFKYGRKVENVG